jgi:hypothetical protein
MARVFLLQMKYDEDHLRSVDDFALWRGFRTTQQAMAIGNKGTREWIASLSPNPINGILSSQYRTRY